MTSTNHRWTPTMRAGDPLVTVQWCADCGALWREIGHDQDGPAVQEYKVVGSHGWVAVRPPCRERGITALAAELYAAIRVAWLKQPDFSLGWRTTYALLEQAHAMREAATRHEQPPGPVFGNVGPLDSLGHARARAGFVSFDVDGRPVSEQKP